MFDDPFVLLLIALVVIGMGGLIFTARREHKLGQPEEALRPITEWRPTGKIDFICPKGLPGDNDQAVFVLRVEEYRRLQSISGAKRVEIHWRNAALQDAKSVVSRHNASRAFMAVDHELPLPIEAPTIVPDDAIAPDRSSNSRANLKSAATSDTRLLRPAKGVFPDLATKLRRGRGMLAARLL
jgi:hypothetical protein